MLRGHARNKTQHTAMLEQGSMRLTFEKLITDTFLSIPYFGLGVIFPLSSVRSRRIDSASPQAAKARMAYAVPECVMYCRLSLSIDRVNHRPLAR